MIKSFKCKDTERIFHREFVRRFPQDMQRTALKKLRMLHNAALLRDLSVFPGNRLAALSGDLTGQHGIRINRQWRICFVWAEGNAHGVRIVDYH